jgi:poly(A) polymerase
MFDTGKKVLEIISQNGGEGRFVGGCVRDHLNGLKSDDIDIATNLTPDEIEEIFSSIGYKVIPTGIDFGTVTLLFENKPFQITTLRSDINCDGRHAKVTYTKSWEEDAKRRDFTFNALYMDANGEVFDYFNGILDLKKGVVRFIGEPEDRIREDYLRILRFFRFHCRFGADEIIKRQLNAVSELRSGLDKISGERIHSEMSKILCRKDMLKALIPMYDTGVLQQITSDKAEFNFEIAPQQAEEGNWMINLITIINNISYEILDQIAKKWRFSKKERSLAARFIDSLEFNLQDENELRSKIRKFGKEEFYRYLQLAMMRKRVSAEEYVKLISFTSGFEIVDFPLSGDDLIYAGFRKGKRIGIALSKAEKMWEESNYRMTKDDLIREVSMSSYSKKFAK